MVAARTRLDMNSGWVVVPLPVLKRTLDGWWGQRRTLVGWWNKDGLRLSDGAKDGLRLGGSTPYPSREGL